MFNNNSSFTDNVQVRHILSPLGPEPAARDQLGRVFYDNISFHRVAFELILCNDVRPIFFRVSLDGIVKSYDMPRCGTVNGNNF